MNENEGGTDDQENEGRTEYEVVFRTGKMWEFDLARDAFRERGIPFYARTEPMSSVMTSVPAMPVGSPGMTWSLLVPEEAAEDAREVLEECRLDMETKPEAWGFAPEQKAKRYWKVLAWAVLIFIGLMLLAELVLRNR